MGLCPMKKFDNYCSALDVLTRAPQQDLTNVFIQSGIIDKFSLQFELSWKLLKALLTFEGDSIAASGSPREIIKHAYRFFDFLDEEKWLRMLRDRNDTTHIYDAVLAQNLVTTVINDYIPAFEQLKQDILERYGEDQLNELP